LLAAVVNFVAKNVWMFVVSSIHPSFYSFVFFLDDRKLPCIII